MNKHSVPNNIQHLSNVTRGDSTPRDMANQVASELMLSQVKATSLEGWGCTEAKLTKFSYTWIIKNFSYFIEDNNHEAIVSPAFFSDTNKEVKWCMKLYPNGNKESCNDYMSIFVELVASKKPKVRGLSRLSFANAKGERIYLSTALPRVNTFTIGLGLGYPKSMKRDFLLDPANQLLPDDNLTIIWDVNVQTDNVLVSGEIRRVEYRILKRQLVNDLEVLFENRQCSDVTIIVGDEKFQAHKMILIARSSIFAAMFDNDMIEQRKNIVEINDMKPEVVKELLRFMYTDSVKNLNAVAADLIMAAEKYDLQKLKIMCEEALGKCLSVNNVTDTLLKADLYNSNILKTRAINFIIMHAVDVMKIEDYKSMTETHPHLTKEIFHAWVRKETSKTDEGSEVTNK